MIKFFRFIKQKNFFFKVSEKVDILFFNKLKNGFDFGNKIKYFELYNQIYIYELFITILYCLLTFNTNLKESYFKTVIKSFSPKIGVGDEINGNIFKFKKFFPEKVAIAFQIVNWSNISVRTNNKKYKCDYFLLFNSSFKKFYKNIDSKFISIGSFQNNQLSLNHKIKKKYDICFISEYRDKIYDKINIKNHVTESIKKRFILNKSIVLNSIGELIKEKKLKICVALSSSRKEKAGKISNKNEINFFKARLGSFYISNKNSLYLAERSKIIISMWSTFGVELFSQGKRVLFICPKFSNNLNWDFFPKVNGLNWYQENNKNEIKKKILDFLTLKQNQWNKYLKFKKYGIIFNRNNSIFNNLVNKILYEFE